jgi:hypothetical protein
MNESRAITFDRRERDFDLPPTGFEKGRELEGVPPAFDRLVDRKPGAPVAISNRIPSGAANPVTSPMRRLDPQDKEAQSGLEQGSLKWAVGIAPFTPK